ncbi:hypothetical protein CSB07_00425 [Candidatus Gracilibacteria bacterium]|nr:MAG: hypothetical protein CSB07_00425 [Candidatus Gracilibacteria bacterium]PIE85111.1 MAG: hypothetical protein CSA08_03640 [Candidatus Gracilibacteria bacterium]
MFKKLKKLTIIIGKMKNIFITGTSRGIGKYLLDNLKNTNNIIHISGRKEVDLRNILEIKNYCKKINESKIKFDILIFNAGVGEFGGFEENSLEDYENIINLNLLSNIRLLKLLQANISEKTKIIFMGSIISKKFMKNASVYQASKFGLRGLAGGLKNEGKKVFLVNPKIVNTDFHKGKIELNNNFPETKLDDILYIIQDIINGTEKRFEIDL